MLPITGSHNLVLWEEGGTLCVLRKELVTTLGDAGDNCAVKVGSHTFTAKLVSEGNYPHRAPKRKIDTPALQMAHQRKWRRLWRSMSQRSYNLQHFKTILVHFWTRVSASSKYCRSNADTKKDKEGAQKETHVCNLFS